MTQSTRPTTLYNPHLLSKEELIAGFIARQPLLTELVDDLRRGGGQHHLLVGSRGTGKTTLLLRVGLALDDDPALARRAIALRFPEEQYNIIRLSDFWLNCLDALVDALERRGATDEAKRLDAQIEEVDALDDEEIRTERALAHLSGWARRAKKLVVLLVDNLDLVFARLSASHWALRKTLTEDKRLVLIGASSSAVPETFEYGQAFYDFFNVHELGGLDDDEARRVLVRLSDVLGTPQVPQAIADNPGRLKSLLLLSGGTPRTLQLLHGVLALGSTRSAERDIELMVDQVTPYYKARFEDLPAQAQQIVDAVALHWHPMTAIECADKTRLDVTLVSAQLTRLARQGVIAKVPHVSGKLGFQIAERFFGIWYMMRASRRLRRKLFWLAVCVQELYGHDEFERQAAALLATSSTQASADPARLLAFAEASHDGTVKRRLERRAVSMLVQASEAGPRWDGLDLDGADRDLKDQAARARRLAAVHRTIVDHIVAPAGMTPQQCADAVTGSPMDSLEAKERVAAAITTSEKLSPLLVNMLRGPEHWPEQLIRAVQNAEVASFEDASTVDDVEDILSAVDDEHRAFALGCIAGGGFRAASDHALARPEPIDVGLAVICSFWKPRPLDRIAKALTRVDDDAVSDWRHVTVWEFTARDGLARAVATLLRELGLHERALPLYEALLAFADGKTGDLIHLAPEVRVPAEQYLTAFHAASKRDAETDTSPLAAPSTTNPRRSGGRTGKPTKARRRSPRT
ncbi:MAG: ATP-binding protein [Myxococcales bacterium]|nr:ATP-binding protein [Myxococcales bacterium]